MDLQVAATIPQEGAHRHKSNCDSCSPQCAKNTQPVTLGEIPFGAVYADALHSHIHCTLTSTALSLSLRSLAFTALSHSLHSRYRCTLASTALSHSLQSRYHGTLTLTALSHSLHSRYHCTLAITAPSSPVHVEIRKFYFYPGLSLGPPVPGSDTLGWALGLDISLRSAHTLPKHTPASVCF